MRHILPIMLIVASANAESIVTHASKTDPHWGADGYRHVDVSSYSPEVSALIAEGVPVRSLPAPALYVDGIGVVITGSVADARSDIRAMSRARRKAERAAVADAREARAAWRTVAKDWRQTGRDAAQAVGLPAATGATWSVEAMYAAISTITNANTRRDLTLRALAADLAQTRYQLNQQYPAVRWWWEDDEESP